MERIKRMLPSVIYFVAVVAIWLVLQSFFVTRFPVAAMKATELKDVQKLALQIVIDLNSLLHSLAVVLIGIFGGFLVKKDDFLKINSIFDLIIIYSSLVMLMMSIYFGYILNFNLVEMLSGKMFDLDMEIISLPRAWQLNSFVAALVLFGWILINNSTYSFNKKKRKPKMAGTPTNK